jgi:PKD repeat protein
MTLKKIQLMSVFSVIFFMISLMSVQTVSALETSMSLDPAIIFAETGESFKVNLTVHSVDFLYAWQANVTYNPEVLSFINVTEGDFLIRQPEGTFGSRKLGEGYAFVGWTTKGEYVGESGSGTLATFEFQVDSTGESLLKIKTDPFYINASDKWIYPTSIRTQGSPNPPPNFKDLYPPEDFTVRNSLFTNTVTPPAVDFTYSPDYPGINQLITFDASTSTATTPLEIVEYTWDFGDGENATVDTPTIQHTYTEGGIYTVSLTVVDNATASELAKSQFNLTDNNMPLIWYELYSTKQEVIEIAFRNDIAVTHVAISKQDVTAGEKVSISVTVKNVGTESASFNVTVFYDTTKVNTEQVADLDSGEEKNLTFEWDTTGVAEGSYQIKAVASAVEGESSLENNEFTDGTVTVKLASESFPIMLVGGALAAIAILVVAFLIYRRKSTPSTESPPIQSVSSERFASHTASRRNS